MLRDEVAILFHESPSQYRRLPKIVLASTSVRSARIPTLEVPKPKVEVAVATQLVPFQYSMSPQAEPGVLASVEVAKKSARVRYTLESTVRVVPERTRPVPVRSVK
jgi:hypothetical protein